MEEQQNNNQREIQAVADMTKKIVGGIRFAVSKFPFGWFIGGTSLIILILIILPVFVVVVIALGLSGGKIEQASDLPPDPVEAAPSPGDPLGLADNFCELYNDPGVNCATERRELKELLEAAGRWAKVPAGVIAGILSIEGVQVFSYTNEEVKAFSGDTFISPYVPGIDNQGIDMFNRTPNQCGAVGPMQFLIDSSAGYPPLPPSDGTCDEGRSYNIWSRYKSAVNLANVSNISNPDARNIRNAIYGGAWKIKCDSHTSPSPECTSGNFINYDNDISNDWEKEDVIAAGSAYYGQCTSTVRNSEYTYCDLIWNYYQKYRGALSLGQPFGWSTNGIITQGPWTPAGNSHYQKSAIDISKSGGGEPIYSTHDGNMMKADERGIAPNGGCGIYIYIISAGGYATYYCHLNSYSPCVAALPNNTFIKAGSYLGNTGWTGWVEPPNASGAHLHYAVKEVSGFVSADKFNSQYVPPYNVGQSVTTSYSGSECKT